MTQDIESELTDEQLAEAVGGSGVAADRLTLTGSISDGPAASGLSKTGTGHLILPTANTYAGRTRVIFGSEVGVF